MAKTAKEKARKRQQALQRRRQAQGTPVDLQDGEALSNAWANPKAWQFELKRELFGPIRVGSDWYMVVETDGNEQDAYLDNLGQRMRYQRGHQAGLKSFKGMQSHLLHLCLRTVQVDANGLPKDAQGNGLTPEDIAAGRVPDMGDHPSEKVVQSWPSSVRSALFDKCQEICGLEDEGDEEDEEGGND